MAASASRRYTHPVVFGVIELPFGAAVGLLQIAIPYWLARQGLSIAQIAAVSAVGFLPHGYKALWVPLLDLVLTKRTWYFIATAITAAFLGALVLFPDPVHHLGPYTMLIVGAQVGAATTSSAVDALMALTSAPGDKGRAAGFKMAGNVGGIGVLGALPIWLQSNVSTSAAGLIVVGITIATAAAGLFVAPEPPHAPSVTRAAAPIARVIERFTGVVRDLWATVRSREGWTGLVFCAAPVGCGALVNLLSGLAPAYGASEHVVELVDGLAGGLVAAVGAILGGFLADRLNRRLAYCLAAGVTALAAFAMAASSLTPTTFIVGSLAYRFANGVTMAAFAGFILEFVGKGRAVATTFTLFVAVSNQAISLVTWLDGQGSRFRDLGARGTVLADAVLTVFGIIVVALMTLLLRGRPAPGVPAHAPTDTAPR